MNQQQRVTFSHEAPEVSMIHDALTKDEKDRMWYTQEELDGIESKNIVIAKSFHRGHQTIETLEDATHPKAFPSRGLETAVQIFQKQSQFVQRLLQEQSRLRDEFGFADGRRLAQTVAQESAHRHRIAHLYGLRAAAAALEDNCEPKVGDEVLNATTQGKAIRSELGLLYYSGSRRSNPNCLEAGSGSRKERRRSQRRERLSTQAISVST